MMLIFLASAGTLWADLGLSFQAMGGYVLDRREIEDGLKKSAQESLNGFITSMDNEDQFDNLLLADVALFVEYNFWYRFFIRTGVEFSTSFDDVKSEGEETGMAYYTIHHSYEYIGVPLILGINIPINRGMHNVYIGAGPCYNMISIKREGEGHVAAVSANDEYEMDEAGIGVVSVLGINTRVFRSLSVSIELTYHDFRKEKEYTIEAKDSGGFTVATVNQKYVFAAPKTSIRLGVRYSI